MRGNRIAESLGMTARLDKAIEMLLELGSPAERRTRAQVLDQALRATLTMMEADAAAILAPWSRRGERLVLHAGSTSAASILLPPKAAKWHAAWPGATCRFRSAT